ncbi:RsmD family RNA methyltransferase [Alphaproteobacteria bacterium]|nr:RsmD family RNA methyltransferase [Alphaproteobacteria bacterium]
MKIISGILKGRKIEVNNKLEYRPTLSRIREDIFNILLHNPNITFDKKNSNFADVYCGSGSIGIEALSRGFKHCHFNDIDNAQIKKISLFLKNFPNLNYSLSDNDISNELDQILWSSFDVIYFDPPYEIKLEPIILQKIEKIKNQAIIITETSRNIFEAKQSTYNKSYKNKFINFFFANELKKL